MEFDKKLDLKFENERMRAEFDATLYVYEVEVMFSIHFNAYNSLYHNSIIKTFFSIIVITLKIKNTIRN